jgi:16S rRNA (cytidine1402-2'-O)-methyltransferase
MAEAFGGDRRAALCRELTKTHEEVRRAGLAELGAWAEAGVRGEVTLVVAGAGPRPAAIDRASLAAAVAAEEAAGVRRKDAIADVARRSGLPRREVYDAVLQDKHGRRPGTPPQEGAPL